MICVYFFYFFFFQAEDGIRDVAVTGVQTCALPISGGELPLEQRDVRHHADDGVQHDEADHEVVGEIGHGYRSTSPKTGSTDPMMATTSATLWPGMMWGRIDRFEKEAPRHFRRYGLAPPSATM